MRSGRNGFPPPPGHPGFSPAHHHGHMHQWEPGAQAVIHTLQQQVMMLQHAQLKLPSDKVNPGLSSGEGEAIQDQNANPGSMRRSRGIEGLEHALERSPLSPLPLRDSP